MIHIDRENCIGCGTCVKECFLFCIRMDETGKAFFKGERRCITCGHCLARCPQSAISTDGYDDSEVIEWLPELNLPDTEELIRLMKFRRSIRSYKNKKVPDCQTLERLLDGARFAGTGGNRQALRYSVIIKNTERVIKEAAEILGSLVEKGGFYAPNYRHIWEQSLAGRDEMFYGAPVIILVIGNKKKGFDVRRDGGLATAYFQLLCETEGLGSCVNGFFGDAFDNGPQLREFLGIKEEECLINAIGVGYPDVTYLRSAPRKKLDLTWL